jgi:hypothetical protein
MTTTYLLYPTQRYVNGLTASEVPNQAGAMVQNPLYTPKGDKPARDKSLVFLAGLIGVPWQDVATDDTRDDARALTYMTAEELIANNRWDMILGNANNGVLPTDPLMIETPDPRTGTHPLTGDPVGLDVNNDINGHEQNVTKRDDLQYACIFPLGMTRNCEEVDDANACDCNPEDLDRARPLCEPAGGGTVGTTQYFAKAYPGTRHLQVLKDFGAHAIVASICPKNVTAQGSPESDPDYGYNPAVGAIINRLKEALTGKCLPRQLVPETDETLSTYGQVPCAVIEATFNDGSGCAPCDGSQGRADPKPEIRPAVVENLAQTGQCGSGGASCSDLCLCEILQLTGQQLNECQNLSVPPNNLYGYCYIDEAAGIGNAALLANCPPTQKRLLNFVGDNVPQPGAVAFIACIGASLGQAEAPAPAP